MNILRMWGGACACKDSFYELCDEYGIMVWQEFMLACNNYVATKHYISVLESEATALILRLRAHPCIAFWCGGNELFNRWSGMDDQSHALRLLNDRNECVSGSVEVLLRIGENEISLLKWDNAKTSANTNFEGASVCCVLPNVDTARITLVLKAEDEQMSNEYRLLYRPNKKKPTVKMLNV